MVGDSLNYLSKVYLRNSAVKNGLCSMRLLTARIFLESFMFSFFLSKPPKRIFSCSSKKFITLFFNFADLNRFFLSQVQIDEYSNQLLRLQENICVHYRLVENSEEMIGRSLVFLKKQWKIATAFCDSLVKVVSTLSVNWSKALKIEVF